MVMTLWLYNFKIVLFNGKTYSNIYGWNGMPEICFIITQCKVGWEEGRGISEVILAEIIEGVGWREYAVWLYYSTFVYILKFP